MSDAKLFYVGVKGLIENEAGEILLLLADVTKHRKNTEPYWDIPGGRIEDGQTAEETLRREIEEETSVTTITETKFLTAIISNHEIPVSDSLTAGLLLMVYRVSISTGSVITISSEHVKYEWVSKNEASERLSHKYPSEFTNTLTA